MNVLPPLPTDLSTALEEIQKLRLQLIQTNEKWARAVERRELDNRANKGTINALQEEIQVLHEHIASKNNISAHCEYCPGVEKPHDQENKE